MPSRNGARIGSSTFPPVSLSCGPSPAAGTGEPDVADDEGVHFAVSLRFPTTSDPGELVTPPGSASGSPAPARSSVGNVTVRPFTEALANRVLPCVCVDFDGVPNAIDGGVNVTPGTLSSTEDNVAPAALTAPVNVDNDALWPSTSIEPMETPATALGVDAAIALVPTFRAPKAANGSSSALTLLSTVSTRSCSASTSELTAVTTSSAAVAAVASVASVVSVAPNAACSAASSVGSLIAL